MNKPITDIKAAVTTGPLPSSRKIFSTPEAAPDLRVPLREIILSEGAGEPNLPVYDTSGPYTDPNVLIDVNAGLPRARMEWVKERGGIEEYQGREIKPEDNGNVGAKHAAAAFKAHHKPVRGVGAAPLAPTVNPSAPKCRCSSRRNSCALRSRAVAPSSPATSTTPN